MNKKEVGIYLGVNSVGAVMLENKQAVSLAKFDLSSVEDEVDPINEEIKWDVIINRALRAIGSQERDVYVSLTDRDFIIRSLELPLMKKREIGPAVIYEIEQYIPFKTKELKWDYKSKSFSKDKKMTVSFLGIRQDNLQKIQELFNRLNLRPVVIEPSSISIVRVIKSLPRFSDLKNFALLDFTKSEAYLTFFYHNLPVFNRYLVIPQEGATFDWPKLIEAVRLSFLYFQREYKSYSPDKIIVLGDNLEEAWKVSLQEDLQIDVETVVPEDVIPRKNATLENLKALGVGVRDSYLYEFKPVLMVNEEQIAGGTGIRSPLKIGLISLCIIAGLIISTGLVMFTKSKLSQERNKLEKDRVMLVIPSGAGSSWDAVRGDLMEKRKRIASLKESLGDFKKISLFLEKLPQFFPKGLWLQSLELAENNNKYRVLMRGNIFLNDSYQERLEIDKFISELKNREEVKSNFSVIESTSSQRQRIGEFMVTSFAIKFD